MLEQEYKKLLTREQYEEVLKTFAWDDDYDQINIYYGEDECGDKPGRPTVRIRSKKGHMMLEAKVPKGASDKAVKVSEEYAREIACVPYVLSGEELSDLTGIADMGERHILGLLATNRKTNHEYEGCEIALDRNEYSGMTDYEIEIEFETELPKELLAKLDFLSIDITKRTVGKYRRFLERTFRK